jgi:Domain of unknown function (DUF4386)
VLARDGLEIVPVATTIGVLAAVVQFLGLARWPFLVPELARVYADPASSEATREATVVAFESFHRYLGIGIGESLGYLLTGAWTVLVGVAMLQSSAFEAWLAGPGIVIGLFVILGSLEFVGRSEEKAGNSRGRSSRSPTSLGRCGSSSRGWCFWSDSEAPLSGKTAGNGRADLLQRVTVRGLV